MTMPREHKLNIVDSSSTFTSATFNEFEIEVTPLPEDGLFDILG